MQQVLINGMLMVSLLVNGLLFWKIKARKRKLTADEKYQIILKVAEYPYPKQTELVAYIDLAQHIMNNDNAQEAFEDYLEEMTLTDN